MYGLVAIIVLCLLVWGVWASADVGSNVYVKSLCKGDKKDKVVSLTFDDGPCERMTPAVLDILKKYHIRATFFLVGSKVEKNPDLVRRMIEEGHLIGNHTYLHQGTFPLGSQEAVKKEIALCNEVLFSVTGLRPKCFRPPFGVTNPMIGKAVKALGLQTIGWSIRSMDTVASISREDICARVKERLHPGAIVLLHDRCADADKLLERLIVEIQEQGYGFISLDEMLKIDVYEN